jgi:hypothetical protein
MMLPKNEEENLSKRINILPNYAYDVLTSDAVMNINNDIYNKLNLNDQQKNDFLDILMKIFLKDIKIEDVLEELINTLKIDKKEASYVALKWLREILFQIGDFFPGIEDEILKLGGEIPKEKPKKLDEQLLKREEEMEEMEEREEAEEEERLKDAIIEKPVEDLIKEFPWVGEQVIGSQKEIILKRFPVPMKPLVKYWLEDYKEKMGYYQHSNIDRVQYVYRDKNTRNMNEEERRQLNLVLKSSDEGITLPYSTRMKKVDFGKID